MTVWRLRPLLLVSALAACADSTTMPRSSPPGGAFGIKPELTSVVLHRTIETEGAGGVVDVRRQTLVQQLRAVPHAEEPGSTVKLVRPADGNVIDPTRLPVPILSAPAKLQSSACVNAQPWTRTVSLPSLPGAVAVATGYGDAPATLVQVMQNGQLIAEVSRSWIRTPRSWDLTRQEVRVTARHYRDVVEVERRAGAGRTLEAPVPLFVCTARDSGAAARQADALDPFGGYRTTSIPSQLEAPRGPRQIDACVADGYDTCQDKRDIKFTADLLYVSASAYVAVTCPTLALVKSDACFRALSSLSAAIAGELAANHALERCMQDQEAKQKACQCAGGVAMEDRVNDGPMTPLSHLSLTPTNAGSYLDCSDTGSSGSEQSDYHDVYSVSTPSSASAGGVYVCVYELDYDLDTNTMTVYPLYCYTQWLE